ncbi:MAG TPA: Rab family GTPase [Anaerolineae bacterium]|nr:GTP-binding protein [Anaerolineae bacterium]MCB0180004.1 GTP-binding protein [Anaerolineae bacterium]MCB9103967.1 GTP-binding protein [Anaerolineales bacterium]HRV93188.1 Rab family GTPase [Anaerolineae bacterium]
MTTINKKVCLLGDFAVGKTSLVRRFVYNTFDDKHLSSIGVKVSRKTMQVSQINGLTGLTMMLWDLADSERFDQIESSYIRGTAGVVLVCDLTQARTLFNLQTHLEDLQQTCPEAKVIVAANKADLMSQQEISPADVAEVAAGFNAPYYLTSAKSGHGIEALFRHLARLLVD